MKKRVLIALAVLLALAATASLVWADPGTLYADDDGVCGGNSPCYTSIQDAVTAANPYDTVHVYAGTYYEHLTINKSLTLQGEDRETTVIDGSGSGNVIYITANDVTITGLKVTNGDTGIRLIPNWVIHHVTIRDVIITSNAADGIQGGNSRYWPGAYHVIEDCIISNNGGSAFLGHQFSMSIIQNCEVFGNGYGLLTGWGFDTVITDNKVHHNTRNGIWLDSMTYTIVEKNKVYNNGTGIGVGYAGRHNTIRDNIVYDNDYGIWMSPERWAGGNKVYHNDLIGNTIQACDDEHVDIWDDGYPSGGNYWSDYTGVDNYSGVNQDVPGSDGIGDTPYTFVGNQDNYPLMRPWNRILVGVDIKPGSDPNSINTRSKGVIPVAILGSDTFDVTYVDVTTLAFGSAGASPAHDLTDPIVYAEHLQDVNADGFTDLVCHYRTQETGIAKDDTEACLEGETIGRVPIQGCDSVRIVK